MPMTPILVISTAHKHSRTLFQKAEKTKKTDQNNKINSNNSNNSSCYRPQKRTRKHSSKEATRQRGRGNAANTQAHEEHWWEPPQPARAQPAIHGVTRRLRCWNRWKIHWLTRSLSCCIFPKIHWATRSVVRYSAAVLTRGFIGRPDPVVTPLQFWPEDSLGDPIRSLLRCSFDPRIHWVNPIRSLLCCSSRPRIHWATQVVTLQVTHSCGLEIHGATRSWSLVCICPRIHWATTAVVTTLLQFVRWVIGWPGRCAGQSPGDSLGDPPCECIYLWVRTKKECWAVLHFQFQF